MLDQEQLKELGRFKLLMRKIHNQSVHIELFLTDFEYQTQMLDIAEEFDETDLENDELMMMSLTFRSRFGRLAGGIAPPVVEAEKNLVVEAEKNLVVEAETKPIIDNESELLPQQAEIKKDLWYNKKINFRLR